MQTFLPYFCFRQSAECLDDKRLGKQRVEVLQILTALTGYKNVWTGNVLSLEFVPIKKKKDGTNKIRPWSNHPASLMWKNNIFTLINYGLIVCYEWTKVRGYKDSCKEKLLNFLHDLPDSFDRDIFEPDFIGNKEFHDSHKSNLLRKDPDFYGQYNWDVPNDLPYVWPSSTN